MEGKSTRSYYCNSAKPRAGSCWRLRDSSKEITFPAFPGFIFSPQHLPSASTEDRTGMGFALTCFSAHFAETNLILTRGPEEDQCYNLPEKSVDKNIHGCKHWKTNKQTKRKTKWVYQETNQCCKEVSCSSS